MELRIRLYSPANSLLSFPFLQSCAAGLARIGAATERDKKAKCTGSCSALESTPHITPVSCTLFNSRVLLHSQDGTNRAYIYCEAAQLHCISCKEQENNQWNHSNPTPQLPQPILATSSPPRSMQPCNTKSWVPGVSATTHPLPPRGPDEDPSWEAGGEMPRAFAVKAQFLWKRKYWSASVVSEMRKSLPLS